MKIDKGTYQCYSSKILKSSLKFRFSEILTGIMKTLGNPKRYPFHHHRHIRRA